MREKMSEPLNPKTAMAIGVFATVLAILLQAPILMLFVVLNSVLAIFLNGALGIHLLWIVPIMLGEYVLTSTVLYLRMLRMGQKRHES